LDLGFYSVGIIAPDYVLSELRQKGYIARLFRVGQ
jgi:hypothetical protein